MRVILIVCRIANCQSDSRQMSNNAARSTKYPLPTAQLGRVAVDLPFRGQRLGESLLFHFLKTACDVAERIGVFAVDLFSNDDDAKRFYLKYGFIPLQDNPFHLYLPMATVRAMFAQAAGPLYAPR